MFEYRRNLRGDAAVPVKDFLLDETYAASAKVQDVVKLDSGKVVAAEEGDTDVLGVFVGPCIKMEKVDDTYGKVQSAEGLVFEASVSGSGTPTVGGKYGITVDSDGNYAVNLDDTTNAAVEVVAVNENRGPDGDETTVDVKFVSLQLG